jgi:hypothetical protein
MLFTMYLEGVCVPSYRSFHYVFPRFPLIIDICLYMVNTEMDIKAEASTIPVPSRIAKIDVFMVKVACFVGDVTSQCVALTSSLIIEISYYLNPKLSHLSYYKNCF